MSVTLTDFMLARIAEDEAVASNAALMAGDRGFGEERRGRGQHWVASYHNVCRARLEDNPGKHVLLEGRALGLDAAKHVARHDPARVLAECEAKRRIVEVLWGYEVAAEGEWGNGRDRGALEAADIYPDGLAALAAVYADHPDYREEWRP